MCNRYTDFVNNLGDNEYELLAKAVRSKNHARAVTKAEIIVLTQEEKDCARHSGIKTVQMIRTRTGCELMVALKAVHLYRSSIHHS